MQQKSQRREYHKGDPMNGQKNDLTKNACYPRDKQAYKWISMDIKGIQ